MSRTALATILRTTDKKLDVRARALGIVCDCGRCDRGFYHNGIGGDYRCWSCSGTGSVVDVSDAGLARAAALAADGTLDKYLDGVRARDAARKAERDEDAKRVAAARAETDALNARLAALRATYASDCETARAYGMSAEIARADTFLAIAERHAQTMDVCARYPLRRAVAVMEMLVPAWHSFVLDNHPDVRAEAQRLNAWSENLRHFE